MEDDVAHLFEQHGGLFIERLAYDYAGAEGRRTRRQRRSPGGELEHRDVDENERLIAQVVQPAEPLESELELTGTPGERHVQLVERFLPQHAVGLEPVSRLEATDRSRQRPFIPGWCSGARSRRRQVAGLDQASCQGIKAGRRGSWF